MRNAVKQSEKQLQRITRLRDMLALVPEGKALLDLADETGCTIELTRDLPIFQSAQYAPSENAVSLRETESDEKLVGSLAHELRHMWQFKKMGLMNIVEVRAIDQMALMRLIEGDAEVFAEYICTKIAVITGKTIDGITIPTTPALRDSFIKTASTRNYWQEQFGRFQRGHDGERADGYDHLSLEQIKAVRSGIHKALLEIIFKNDNIKGDDLSDIFNKRASDVYGDLRRLAVMGVNDDAPCYLPYASTDEMLDALTGFIPENLVRKGLKIEQSARRRFRVADKVSKWFSPS